MFRPCQRTQNNGDASIPLFRREGFRQLKIAYSRPYCRPFNTCKSWCKERPCFVSDLQQAFSLFQNNKPYDCFLYSKICHFPFKQPAKARVKPYANRCHASAETHKFNSAVLASGVPFRKSASKILEHILPCKSNGPCLKLSARVPKFWSAMPKMNVV